MTGVGGQKANGQDKRPVGLWAQWLPGDDPREVLLAYELLYRTGANFTTGNPFGPSHVPFGIRSELARAIGVTRKTVAVRLGNMLRDGTIVRANTIMEAKDEEFLVSCDWILARSEDQARSSICIPWAILERGDVWPRAKILAGKVHAMSLRSKTTKPSLSLLMKDLGWTDGDVWRAENCLKDLGLYKSEAFAPRSLATRSVILPESPCRVSNHAGRVSDQGGSESPCREGVSNHAGVNRVTAQGQSESPCRDTGELRTNPILKAEQPEAETKATEPPTARNGKKARKGARSSPALRSIGYGREGEEASLAEAMMRQCKRKLRKAVEKDYELLVRYLDRRPGKSDQDNCKLATEMFKCGTWLEQVEQEKSDDRREHTQAEKAKKNSQIHPDLETDKDREKAVVEASSLIPDWRKSKTNLKALALARRQQANEGESQSA